MKVSAVIITYNQEDSLATAVESALMQKTNFDFEIVIAEDHSTDGTGRVAKELERRYPGKVRALCREKNLGAIPNLLDALSACRGQYVAFLEGDDRWTDPNKLQRQADFLDARADCSLCCHAVNYVHVDGSQPPLRFPDVNQTKTVSSLEDVLAGVNFHTCSYMFRRPLLSSPPDWLRTLWIGDWPILMLLAEQGDVGYIDEVMAEYRIHPGGVWSDSSQTKKLEGLLQVFRCARRHLGSRCSGQTALLIASRASVLSHERDLAGSRDEARQLLLEAVTVLLEETPSDQHLIDGLMDLCVLLVNQTPTAALLNVQHLNAEVDRLGAEIAQRDAHLESLTNELATLKSSVAWRVRQKLSSVPGLRPVLAAVGRFALRISR